MLPLVSRAVELPEAVPVGLDFDPAAGARADLSPRFVDAPRAVPFPSLDTIDVKSGAPFEGGMSFGQCKAKLRENAHQRKRTWGTCAFSLAVSLALDLHSRRRSLPFRKGLGELRNFGDLSARRFAV